MTKRGRRRREKKKRKLTKMKRRRREGMRLMKKGWLIFRENTKSADLSIAAQEEAGRGG